jgi:hypothetical protein
LEDAGFVLKVIDPENGLTVEAHTQTAWQFTESTSLAGELSVVYHNSSNLWCRSDRGFDRRRG